MFRIIFRLRVIVFSYKDVYIVKTISIFFGKEMLYYLCKPLLHGGHIFLLSFLWQPAPVYIIQSCGCGYPHKDLLQSLDLICVVSREHIYTPSKPLNFTSSSNLNSSEDRTLIKKNTLCAALRQSTFFRSNTTFSGMHLAFFCSGQWRTQGKV